MSLTNENGMVMPVSPMYGGGYGSGFGGGFGGDGFWVILFLFALLGGWGNGFGGFGGGGAIPFMNTNNDIQRGFDQSAVMGALTGITGAVNDVQGALCNGFAQAEIAANARQISDLQQMFSLQSQMAQCCCDNRAATADLKYTVATEACADRAAITNALRDVLEANSASTQRILDQMCADKIDAKNEKIADLERQLTMANLAASQNAQTATILANNEAQTTALEQYLAPVPRPAYIVQNPNCCGNNYGYGCGGMA